MHELSIAQEIIRIIEAERDKHGFSTVEVVRIRAGSLSGIEPRALEFAFQLTQAETCAVGARLEVEAEPMQLLCQNCGFSLLPGLDSLRQAHFFFRDFAKLFSITLSPDTSASFFARDQRLTWASRRRASTNDWNSSEWTKAVGGSFAVVRQAFP